MKILQINTVVNKGSVGRITLDLYNTISENGSECAIAYGRGDAPCDIKTIRVNSKLDFYMSVMRTFITGEHGFGLKRSTQRLIKRIKEYNPDIIHIHNLHGFYINIEELFEYIKKENIPVVWTLHDCWSFTGHCAYFDYAKCDKWKKECSNCPQYKNAYPYGLLHDNSKNNFYRKKEAFLNVKNMTIVTPCQWLKELAKQSFLGDYPIKVIYNGIDLNRFKPLNEKNASDKKIILGVANVWEKRKGLIYFEKLADMLDDSYEIVLIGLSEKQQKKINPKIRGISRTADINELVQWYSKALVYINTTMEDNFPTTNLESLACGTPVITFKTGGSIEAIDKSCGRIVNQADVAALKEAVKEIESMDREELKEACIKRAKLFDKNDRFLEYFELYKKIYKYNQ